MLSTCHRWTVACVCLTTRCVVGSGRAAEDDAVLRARAPALNDVEGDEVIQRKVRALVADAAGTRKLLVLAVSLAREKAPPFQFNAAFVLGEAARRLQDV